MYNEKEKKIRGRYLKRKEDNLKNKYIYAMNMVSEGSIKQNLYDIFKDELEILNNEIL